jgi:transcription-repair coupling factor (superfamily II helicase)
VGYELYIKLLNEAVLEEQGQAPAKELDCTVTLQADAYLPDRYVRNQGQRMALYKRIALITTEEDRSDILDELCDRYGEPPHAVTNLLRIALIRALAVRCGISAVTQDGSTVRLQPEQFDVGVWSELSAEYREQLRVVMSDKPAVNLRLRKDDFPVDAVYTLLTKLVQIIQQNEVEKTE